MRIGFLDFSVTFMTRIVGLFMVLGTQSCLAWVLGPEGRGAYAVCLIFSMMLTLVFLLGCESASIYFVAAKHFTLSEGAVYVSIYSLLASILAMTVGLLLLQGDFEFLSKATHSQFLVAILTIPFGIFSTVFLRLFVAVRDIACYSTVSIAGAVGNLLFTLIFVGMFKGGVEGALFANISSETVIIVLCFYFFRTRFQLGWTRPNLNGMKKILVYGSKYYVGKISNQANAQMGTMIMAFFSNQAEIGMFSVAMRLMAQVLVIPDSLNKVLSPRIAGDPDGRRDLVAECFRLAGISCGILLLVIAILAHPIVTILFSPAFLPAVPLIQVLAVGMTLRCGSKMLEPYFLGTNRPGYASLSVALGAVVNILLLYLLLPRIGMMGAAIGVLGSHLASLLILCLAFKKFSGTGLIRLFAPRTSDLSQVADSIRSIGRFFCEKSQPKEEKNRL
ncbi:MAG: polysaccharide biosynthesis C-terminal domain-containing protein [Syntrophotaleaceae bacterium]